MIELPESHTLAAQLRQRVAGRRIARAAADVSPHKFAWYTGDPTSYGALMIGRTIGGASAYGGHVEIELEALRLCLSDGVNLRWHQPDAELPAKHQLYIELDDGSMLTCSVQMYGGLQLFSEGSMDDNFYYAVCKEKPSPLTDDFTESYFGQIVSAAKPNLSAKGLLATEQRIPGLGNGVLQDILYRAKINPRTRLRCLSDAQLSELFRTVKHTLAEMTEKGGRSTERDLFGVHGGYPSLMTSKTMQFPCTVCGSPIARNAYMGGTVYYCPICQPVLE